MGSSDSTAESRELVNRTSTLIRSLPLPVLTQLCYPPKRGAKIDGILIPTFYAFAGLRSRRMTV